GRLGRKGHHSAHALPRRSLRLPAQQGHEALSSASLRRRQSAKGLPHRHRQKTCRSRQHTHHPKSAMATASTPKCLTPNTDPPPLRFASRERKDTRATPRASDNKLWRRGYYFGFGVEGLAAFVPVSAV